MKSERKRIYHTDIDIIRKNGQLFVVPKNKYMCEFTGSYYECNNCKNITDYSDSHCPQCGHQDETELNENEVLDKAKKLLIVRDLNKNNIGNELIKMVERHN